MVKTLLVRSQRASLRGTSMSMRARPSSSSAMRFTRPMGKPENVRSMPMLTPSALSATSVSRCPASNTPRAYSTYTTKPTATISVRPSSSPTLNCKFFGSAVTPGSRSILDVLYSEREHLDEPEREEQAHHPSHHCHGCGAHLARRLRARRDREHGDRQAEREALEREADQRGGIEYSRDRARVLVETPGGEAVHREVGSHEHQATAKNGERCHRYPSGQHPRQKFAFERIHVL